MATTINVSSGEVFSDTVPSKTSVFILDGGSAFQATLISQGYMGVTDGGRTTSVAASTGGMLYVSQGGVAEDTLLGSRGIARVLNEGTVSKIEVNPYASMFVSSGGKADDIVENGGNVEVSSGGTANFKPNVISGLVMDMDYQRATIHSGTTAVNATISAYNCNLYVYDGGLAGDTVISSGGMVIYEGGSANGISIQCGDFALSGGKATNVAMDSYGWISVLSGGLMESATVNNGYMYLSSGGTATDTMVASLGLMLISRIGSAARTEIRSGGHVELYTEGAMTDVTVHKGGVLSTVSDTSLPGVIDGLVLEQGGSAVISKGFNVTNVKENGGAIDEVNGGEATFVSNTFTGLELAEKERATVHSGTTAVKTTLGTSATLDIYNGGSAVETVMSEYRAVMNVYEGGLADGVAAGNNAYVNVNGGTATNVSLENNAGCFIYSGGVISGLEMGYDTSATCYGEISDLVMSGGSMDIVSSSGKLTNAQVNGGELRVTSSASAIGVTVNAGFLGVTYDANLNSATIHSGASMNVGGGLNATASNVVVSGGQLNLYSGGAIDKLEVMDNIDPETWSGTVGKVTAYGGTLDHTSMTGYGSVTLSSGAVANNTVLSRTDELRSTYGGEFYVYNGAVANNTVIGENYNMRIWVGGSASGVTVLSGGFLDVGSQGGAYLTGAEISSGGWGRFSPGTTATELVVRKGAYVEVDVAPGTDVQGTYDGSAFHVRNGLLSDFTVLDGGVTPVVFSGGTVTNVSAVVSGGYLTVSGGTVLGTVTVEKGGEMFCYGGTVEKVIENGGYVSAHPYYGTTIEFGSNTFSGVHLTSGQSATVHSGTTAVGTILQGIYSSGAGASLRIYEGGVASDTEAFDCGYVEVSSGGTAVNTLLHASGRMMIENGGTAIGATLKDGGYIYASNYSSGQVVVSDTVISSTGALYLAPYSGCVSACNTVVESGGTLYLAPAGSSYPHVVLSGTTIKSGAVIERISSSYYPIGRVSAFDTVLESGVTLTPYEQDYYSRTTLKGNAVFEIGSGVYVDTVDATEAGATVRVLSSGGVESALIGSGASMAVTPYGEAYCVVVDGGTMRVPGTGEDFTAAVYSTYVTNGTVTVESGGILYYASAGAGGRIELGSDCWATGDFHFAAGGEMYVEAGGQIYFQINEDRAPSPHIIVNDISRFTGAPDYRILVKSNQQLGTYTFASGAESFDGTISVLYSNAETLDPLFSFKTGETVKYDDRYYTLHEANGDLGLTITDIAGIEVSRGDIDNSGISDVLFQWTGGGYQLGYWMNGRSVFDGESCWRCAGATHSKDWEVLGNYVMDGDGNADTVLFGNVQPEGGIKGAYIGYYKNGVDLDENWVTIGYLTNEGDIDWQNKVGNLTGNPDANSILWYAPELYALGVWKEGREDWQTISNSFGGEDWTLAGCGDFDGDGKDSVVMSYANGAGFCAVELDSTVNPMGSANWSGWEIRGIGDFSGDRKDDIVLFHKESGSMVLLADGNLDSYTSIGQLNPDDWFVVGAGDYNGDQKDDLLVRQYSTGTLGYYVCADQSRWVELGDGVGMEWTVIA